LRRSRASVGAVPHRAGGRSGFSLLVDREGRLAEQPQRLGSAPASSRSALLAPLVERKQRIPPSNACAPASGERRRASARRASTAAGELVQLGPGRQLALRSVGPQSISFVSTGCVGRAGDEREGEGGLLPTTGPGPAGAGEGRRSPHLSREVALPQGWSSTSASAYRSHSVQPGRRLLVAHSSRRRAGSSRRRPDVLGPRHVSHGSPEGRRCASRRLARVGNRSTAPTASAADEEDRVLGRTELVGFLCRAPAGVDRARRLSSAASSRRREGRRRARVVDQHAAAPHPFWARVVVLAASLVGWWVRIVAAPVSAAMCPPAAIRAAKWALVFVVDQTGGGLDE